LTQINVATAIPVAGAVQVVVLHILRTHPNTVSIVGLRRHK